MKTAMFIFPLLLAVSCIFGEDLRLGPKDGLDLPRSIWDGYGRAYLRQTFLSNPWTETRSRFQTSGVKIMSFWFL
jgi:hypothetical protein